jgi:subtilase-type serine protease
VDSESRPIGSRADTIIGNYVIPGSCNTGGLLYNLTTGAWTAFSQTTASGVSYPGSVSSSPYGPNFGS